MASSACFAPGATGTGLREEMGPRGKVEAKAAAAKAAAAKAEVAKA
jgi:hypothetical protein